MTSACPTRRAFVAGTAVVTVLPFAPAEATPEMLAAAIKEVVSEAPVQPGRVTLDIPPLVDRMIPRDIIQTFTATWNDVEIFRLKPSPAVAANPYVSFFAVAPESGTIRFRREGDRNFSAEQSFAVTVA